MKKFLTENNIDPDEVELVEFGTFIQVLKDGELLGYIMKEGMEFKPSLSK